MSVTMLQSCRAYNVPRGSRLLTQKKKKKKKKKNHTLNTNVVDGCLLCMIIFTSK